MQKLQRNESNIYGVIQNSRLRRFLLMLSLSVLLLSCVSSRANAEIIYKYVPEGFQTTEPGYWASKETGATILEALRSYRRQRDEYKSAYEAEKAAGAAYVEGVSSRVFELEENLDAERAAWGKRVSSLEAQVKRYKGSRWGVGVFGGYDPIRGEAVCGVGVTYSVFRF